MLPTLFCTTCQFFFGALRPTSLQLAHLNPASLPLPHCPSLQRVPELTLYRQRPGCVDQREKIASLPYQRATRPTWIHQASLGIVSHAVHAGTEYCEPHLVAPGEAGHWLVHAVHAVHVGAGASV